MSENNTSGNLMMPQLSPAVPSTTFHACAWHIPTGLFSLVMAVLWPIFTSTYFQLPVRINVVYVKRVQQHLQSRLCVNVSSSSEGTYLGIDWRPKSPILSIGDNAPWVPIKKYGENFEVYGYQGKQDPPEILEKGTYTAAYDIPTGSTIILAWHNGLGRKNNGNVFIMLPFMMR